MIVKQWGYREHRIELDLSRGNFVSLIYAPGRSDELSYTPVVEVKHGQQAAETAAETFVDDRLEERSRALV